MARDELLQIRISTQEKERLQLEAERRGVSMSEVIRDYIKRLPKSKKEL
ncbi:MULTISPECIES: ribbon-helix-helix protein, CopG family [Oscillatoria]|uniref:Ribbon-helix-helix protein, copG family n=1 Tax=Oscillatoria acuminata PCC 6304 TaxID=56110 RepID=K9TKX7_9CYAN|nr:MULTISPECIES: ribbon-helix-helix protein, CopG family [Oscillatoria]AFY82679.1 Ribbon-helix-helix protein, copG family [Oscillatoria acuminata PCC 6304]